MRSLRSCATKRSDQFPLRSFQPIASNWCHSVVERVNVGFEWTIHEYELRGPGKRLESTTFKAVHNKSVTWYLILKDKGISLYSFPLPTHDMRVQTAFVNAKRGNVFSNEITTKEYSIGVNETPRKTRLDKRNELIVNGALTIYCGIETLVDRKSLSCRAAYIILSNHWTTRKNYWKILKIFMVTRNIVTELSMSAENDFKPTRPFWSPEVRYLQLCLAVHQKRDE